MAEPEEANLADLPGADEVARGVRDLNAGLTTPQALLVACAVTRLRALGVPITMTALPPDPDLALYAALGRACDDPYARYNALRRELVSFMDALAARRSRRTTMRG